MALTRLSVDNGVETRSGKVEEEVLGRKVDHYM
jgi:hypothetical protein